MDISKKVDEKLQLNGMVTFFHITVILATSVAAFMVERTYLSFLRHERESSA